MKWKDWWKKIFFRNKNIKLNMIKIGKMIDELFSKLNIFLIYFTKLKELIYNLLLKVIQGADQLRKVLWTGFMTVKYFYDSLIKNQ